MKDLSLHILDIVHNSVRAKANRIDIVVERSLSKDLLIIKVIDNGSGMDKECLKYIADPFYTSRTSRKVGLGIPLLKQKTELCNGSFQIKSSPGKGTRLLAKFQDSHIDLPEMGDIAGVVAMLSCSFPYIRFVFNYYTNISFYHYDTEEIKEALDGVPINTPGVELFIKEMIEGALK